MTSQLRTRFCPQWQPVLNLDWTATLVFTDLPKLDLDIWDKSAFTQSPLRLTNLLHAYAFHDRL